jgi:hypothetical protein
VKSGGGTTLAFTNSFPSTGGDLVFTSGNLSFSNALDVGVGRLGGTGRIPAPNITTGGDVAPGNSAGQLNIKGNLTLLSASTPLFELTVPTPGIGYDVLAVNGSAALNGLTKIGSVSSYAGIINSATTFTGPTSNSLTGAFTNVPTTGLHLPTIDGFGSFQVNFGASSIFAANSVVRSNFVSVPEPSTRALLVSGVLMVAFQFRRRGPPSGRA